MPDLLATLGIDDAGLLGCSLLLPSGVVLSQDLSLADQGVGTGSVLCLVTGAEPPVVHDDDTLALHRLLGDWLPGAGVQRAARLAMTTVAVSCLGGLLAVAPPSPF